MKKQEVALGYFISSLKCLFNEISLSFSFAGKFFAPYDFADSCFSDSINSRG